jgi:DNA-binding NtrC family response regulator
MQAHNWPGNVRELENTIARACALASSSVLLPADIPLATSTIASRIKLDDAIDRILNSAPSGNIINWVISQLAQRAVELSESDLKQTSINLGISQQELKKILAP